MWVGESDFSNLKLQSPILELSVITKQIEPVMHFYIIVFTFSHLNVSPIANIGFYF